MIDTILNYSRFALLGIAMAFVINPYYASTFDYDGDGINDTDDVCQTESYDESYHENCLTTARFYLEYGYFDFSFYINLIQGEIRFGVTWPFRQHLNDTVVKPLKELEAYLNEKVIDTFEKAAIKTCQNLLDFAQGYHTTADVYELIANLALHTINIIGLLTIIPQVGAVVLAISVLLLLIARKALNSANAYRKAGFHADYAWLELCGIRYSRPPLA